MRSINQSTRGPEGPAGTHPGGTAGGVRPLALVLVFLILGISGGAYWYYHTGRIKQRASDAAETGSRLSDATRAALHRLRSPVEIRFYSLLAEAGGPDSLRAFSGRVDQLLSDYEQEGDGKIRVTRYDSRSEADLDAASSDGITAFNLDRGEPCYLGLSVAQEDRKEALPRITPDWEEALEADLTRAILRLTGARSLAARTAATARADSAADDEVKRAIPNFDDLPVGEARRILRNRAIEESKAVATEMQTRAREARRRLSQAQDDQSESAQIAAMKELRQARAAQAEQLREIAARLEAQITALERLKGK